MPISDLSKEQLEQFAKESTNWKELMIKCGYTNLGCRSYLKRKLDNLNISISHFSFNKSQKRYTHDEIFKENSNYASMTNIKKKLINNFNWKYECSSCKLSEWMGQKIPIEIDHINGIHTDNRIENLRFLCPNCHALTDTYKGRNIKNKEHSKHIYDNIKINTTCNLCGDKKYRHSQLCFKCFQIAKKNKITNIKKENSNYKVKENKCLDCTKIIQNDSERCIECYKEARRKGLDEKTKKNINNMKNCPDCNKFISKKSIRCRQCNYLLLKSKSKTNSKEQIKGQCLDCNSKIDYKAIRCVTCSNKIVEKANNILLKNCIDCNKNVWSNATRCVECNIINSRKVERPTYEQLIKDKESLSMVQIGKKYNVSDNTIRKWIKRYELEYKQ